MSRLRSRHGLAIHNSAMESAVAHCACQSFENAAKFPSTCTRPSGMHAKTPVTSGTCGIRGTRFYLALFYRSSFVVMVDLAVHSLQHATIRQYQRGYERNWRIIIGDYGLNCSNFECKKTKTCGTRERLSFCYRCVNRIAAKPQRSVGQGVVGGAEDASLADNSNVRMGVGPVAVSLKRRTAAATWQRFPIGGIANELQSTRPCKCWKSSIHSTYGDSNA